LLSLSHVQLTLVLGLLVVCQALGVEAAEAAPRRRAAERLGLGDVAGAGVPRRLAGELVAAVHAAAVMWIWFMPKQTLSYALLLALSLGRSARLVVAVVGPPAGDLVAAVPVAAEIVIVARRGWKSESAAALRSRTCAAAMLVADRREWCLEGQGIAQPVGARMAALWACAGSVRMVAKWPNGLLHSYRPVAKKKNPQEFAPSGRS